MNAKRQAKAGTPKIFPTLDEWERMPQQSQDAYLSRLQRPQWFSEPEPSNLTPEERSARFKAFRECELTQFLLYLAGQLSTTRKGMEANIRAIDRMSNKFLDGLFALPPATNSFNLPLPDLISLREAWIKACEEDKRAAMVLYYESPSISETMFKKLLEQVGAIRTGQRTHDQFFVGLGQTVNEIDRNTRPKRTPHGTYKVTQEDAARRLGRTVRTIKNWEAGEHTPEGYSRETRRTLETFMAWALSWQAEQKSKLNTKKAMRYADEHGYTFGASQR